MTLQDIRNVEFTKGRGYRAEEVDDFIDECVAEMERILRENAETNQKMKALADKLAEYRNDEDNIRSALLSAQRTGDAILREAEAKAKALLESAQQDADAARRELLTQVESEREELARIKREVAAFKEKMLDIYKEHLSLIKVLPTDEPVTSAVENKVEEKPAAEVPDDNDDSVVVAPGTEEPVQTEPDEEMKPMSRFEGLKFGNDYDIHNDEEDDEDDAPSRGLFRKKK